MTDTDSGSFAWYLKTFKDIDWIIVYPYIDPIIPEGWVEIEFEDSEKVSDSYHLYVWGEENERCP